MALVTISGETIHDSVGGRDNRPWYAWAADYQDGSPGVVTPRRSKPLVPSNGVLTFDIEAGITAWIENPDGQRYLVTTPNEDADLWDVISASIAYPPDTPHELLESAVGQFLLDHGDEIAIDAVVRVGDTLLFKRDDATLGDPVDISDLVFDGDMDDITDATAIGKAVARAATRVAARAAIDALSSADVAGEVAAAIADDGTVVAAAEAAAEAAVDADIAGRDLVETIEGFPLGVEGGFVGENGFGTDILFDAEGHIVLETLVRWLTRLQVLGVPETFDSSWFGTGFVGENGVATELITDGEGKVLQPSVDAWYARANKNVGEPAEIVLPSTLYLVAGETYRLEYAKIISCYDPTTDVIVTGPAAGTGNYGTYWEHTPSAATTFTLTVTVKNREGVTVVSTSRPVVVLAAPNADDLRLLAVGDSITQAGTFVENAAQDILAGATVGTRTYDDGGFSREGRGGWRTSYYATRIGQTATTPSTTTSGAVGDSPFLFPVGVDAEHFLGNTEFWAAVVDGDPTGYGFEGFQKIAKGWGGGGDPFLFDATGYPTSPVTGDVVVDPSLSAGSQWREWDGDSWETMSPQPATELSFTKYMTRYADAFPEGGPTAISIMLATNDFFSSIDGVWDTYKAQTDAFIASIRAWDADVPIILCGGLSPGPNSFWGLADANVNRADFGRRMVDFSQRLYRDYDTDTARTAHVFVAPMLGVVADANMSDYVHPATGGHDQMAPWLAGVLAHLITEEEI